MICFGVSTSGSLVAQKDKNYSLFEYTLEAVDLSCIINHYLTVLCVL